MSTNTIILSSIANILAALIIITSFIIFYKKSYKISKYIDLKVITDLNERMNIVDEENSLSLKKSILEKTIIYWWFVLWLTYIVIHLWILFWVSQGKIVNAFYILDVSLFCLVLYILYYDFNILNPLEKRIKSKLFIC